MERSLLSVPLSPLTGANKNGNFSGRLESWERNESSRAAPNFSGQNENAPGRKNASPTGEEISPKSDGTDVPAVSERGVRRKKTP